MEDAVGAARRNLASASPSEQTRGITPHGALASFALVSLREDAIFVGGAMTIGTVRWYDVRKGYGFLKPEDGGVDVLINVCAVERAGMASLNQGQHLSFEVVYDERIGRSCAENLIASEIRTPPLSAFSPTTPLPHDRRAI